MHKALIYAAFGWLTLSGVMHFFVDVVSYHLQGKRIPGPETTLYYGLQLADRGLKAIAEDRHLRAGLNVHRGRVTNRAVAEALGYESHTPEAVLMIA